MKNLITIVSLSLVSSIGFSGTLSQGESVLQHILNMPEVKSAVEKVILEANANPYSFAISEQGSTSTGTFSSVDLIFRTSKCKMLVLSSYEATTKETVVNVFAPMLCVSTQQQVSSPVRGQNSNGPMDL